MECVKVIPDDHARYDQIETIVQGTPTKMYGVGDVDIRLWTAGVGDTISNTRYFCVQAGDETKNI